jgi:FKBP-type peptidyl-prolyl cis-trans isomerase 2
LEILEADEENITIDMNHPMAGKTLIFDMELVEIKDKSQVEELPSFDLSEVQVEDLPSDI